MTIRQLGAVLQTSEEEALTDFQFSCVDKDNVSKGVTEYCTLLSCCTPQFTDGEQRYYETPETYYVVSPRDSKIRKFVRRSDNHFYAAGVIKS